MKQAGCVRAHWQPELAQGLAPGAFYVKARKLWACCFCRVGRPRPGGFETQSWLTASCALSLLLPRHNRPLSSVVSSTKQAC